MSLDGSLSIHIQFNSAGLTGEKMNNIIKKINTKVSLSNATFTLKHTALDKAILVLYPMHCKLNDKITQESKSDKFVPMPKHEDSIESKEAAGLVNEFIQKVHKISEVNLRCMI